MSHRPPDTMAAQSDAVGSMHSSTSDTRTKIANQQSRIVDGMLDTTPLSQGIDGSEDDYTRNNSSLKVPVNLFANQEQSLGDPQLDLPPYDLLYALVDLYFEHINTWCPILHRRTTLDTFFGPSPLEEADRMVLYAIVATTLRFSTDPRLTESNRKRYYETAKQKVILYGLENSSVKSVQALVILALDFVGSSNGPPGWKLLALIARSVVQLGLNAESGSSLVSSAYPSIYTLRAVVLPDAESWIEDESRRRLFWMVYLLDRYSTIATAFDFVVDDKDIDRKLPCRNEYFTRNQPVETRWFRGDSLQDRTRNAENVGAFGFYVEILDVLSRIHTFLKKPVDIGAVSDVEEWQTTYRKLDSELRSWELNLPHDYAYEHSSRLIMNSKANKGFQCDWVMLHATYQTYVPKKRNVCDAPILTLNSAVIRLHSSAAYPTTRSPIFTPSYSASQRCLAAVNNILTLTRFVHDNHILDKLGPPFAFTLWVCARLLLVHGSTIARTVSPDIFVFVETLAQMGRYWKVAERYSSILQRVLDEYNEYEQAAASDEHRATPSSVKILADMRRCAFDLDYLISRQPRDGGRSGHSSSNPNNHHSAHLSSHHNNNLYTNQSNNSNHFTMNAVVPDPNTTSATTSLARNPGPNELEYLDVFGFFNVPRVLPSNIPMQMPTTLNENSTDNNGVNNTTNNEASTTTNNTSDAAAASDANNAQAAAAAAAVGPATVSCANEFNITNYLIPTPETDWLFRSGSD